ncbi:NAD(P)/FAD-dependent oxidoreductase [Bernardetia sp. OM2101]|uniref:NAD(P)/FAD-dependent oxidoreductase n=1 Tax=Bernardetia sp. OM2101 TaxID=3344876 RepID=UPI0035CEFFB5
MKKELSFVLPPEIAFEKDAFEKFIREKLDISSTTEDVTIRQTRRSLDARQRDLKVNVWAEVFINEKATPTISYTREYPNVKNAPQAIIVGAGPAGMFAALRLVELGIKPILIERGKDVKKRVSDIAAISRRHIVNPDSNYCFGEGGAGTYSDGKLYTRAKKRGDWRRILEIFVAHGASEDILIDNHPHIGTNKLPRIVAEMRQSILDAGGEVLFETKVTDFIVTKGKEEELKGVVLENGDKIEGIGVILATGHSARDIFELLDRKKILIEAKPFAIGVRVEHQQKLIDKIQYKREERDKYLPAASYSLVQQVPFDNLEKGVFSFCMCPGGFIVPAATLQGEVVVNGMSPSKRNSKYANSGIVVAIDEREWNKKYAKKGALAGLYYQEEIEKNACQVAGNTQAAPAQRLLDFTQKKVSSSLLDTSYQPGLISVEMGKVLPPEIVERLRMGFKAFDKKMKGFLTNEAQIVGVESRTSSPVRIPRERETNEHPILKRFFPCGEGAGYAGGIASAAMDGERCAERLAELYGK